MSDRAESLHFLEVSVKVKGAGQKVYNFLEVSVKVKGAGLVGAWGCVLIQN